MLMNQVLDSSNASRDLDERSRPLKRSASVASLPTPPRTHHRRSRSRARSFVSHHDSDDGSASELDDHLSGGYTKQIKRAKTSLSHKRVSYNDEELSEDESPEHKKRRTLGVLPGHDEDEEDENAFWTGRGSSYEGKRDRKAAEADEKEESSPSPALLRYRVKAPVSPPPSRRQPVIQPARAASVEREESLTVSTGPVTPPRKLLLRAPSPSAIDTFKTPTKSKATKIWPERDSPNNPFLVESSKVKLGSDWDSSDDEEVVGEARVREGTPTPTFEEKPTITYVFRGQKATFHNPLYELAPEVVAASKLPINHPDFEAVEACPPKKLFAAGRRKSRDRSRESTPNERVGHAKVKRSEEIRDETSEGEQSGSSSESCKALARADSVEAAAIPSNPSREAPVDDELHRARGERERRETAAKARLAPRDGLRAGAVFAERDEPARRAIGPLRSA